MEQREDLDLLSRLRLGLNLRLIASKRTTL